MPIMPDLPEFDKTNIAMYVLEGRLKDCGYLRIAVEIPGASSHSAPLGPSTGFLARLSFFDTETLTPAASDATVGDSPCQR
jgi:hypothetical protein